ncbi:DUF6504 family protein [Janibacter sp. GS2]|uniref:DUF6504 family protein n=1 Tax=Janibacter sp. GS2 TaxID=3442646 RepID=UPI003EBA2E3F
MVRLVEEPIEVRCAEPQRTGAGCQPGEESAAPEQFVWRGRLYRVTEVVDHWQERRPWWRSTAERPLSQVPLAREVWRVSASRGRSSPPGVYDLGADSAGDTVARAPAWLLLRTQD